MTFVRQCVLFLSFLLCVTGVQAQRVTDLYQADVPVQAGQAAKQLTERAWGQVLGKLTGQTEQALPDSVTQLPYRTLQALVERFQYESTPSGRQFHVSFSVPSVNALLKTKQVALWSPDRPLTLCWVMRVSETGAVNLLSMDSPDAQPVLLAAQQKAYPVILPLGDLSDDEPLTRMSAAVSSAALQALSVRYHVHRVLVARLKSGVASEWVWWTDQGGEQRWEQPYQPDESLAVLSGLNHAIKAEATSNQTPLTQAVLMPYSLWVLGVNTVADSERLAKRLTQQRAAFQWQHAGLSQHVIRVHLLSRRTRASLRRALSHVTGLSPLFHDKPKQVNSDQPLVYVWGNVSPEQRAAWLAAYKPSSLPASTTVATSKASAATETPESADTQSFAYHAEETYQIPGAKEAKQVDSKQPLLPKTAVTPKDEAVTTFPIEDSGETHD